MTKTLINIDALWTDTEEIKNLLQNALKTFAPALSVLYTKTEGLKEVKVCNGNDYYCISQIVGTRGDVNDDRWAIAILKLDAENLLTYKYMHPTTQEIVMNPSELAIATLPKL